MLVTGGYGTSGYLNSSELYDRLKGVWTLTGNMNYARQQHTASVLTNGKVLVTGGYGTSGNLNSVALYDPSTGVWTLIVNMTILRV